LIIFTFISIKINCAVYYGEIGFSDLIDAKRKDCISNLFTKYIISVPKFDDKYSSDIIVCTEITGLDDFDTNPWLWRFCCWQKKSKFSIQLPFNFFKKNTQELKSHGDIISLVIKDTENKEVILNLKICFISYIYPEQKFKDTFRYG
jgi:hypothetical protein